MSTLPVATGRSARRSQAVVIRNDVAAASLLTGRSTKREGTAVTVSEPDGFEDQLTNLLPKMRVWALALTRNATGADELVQDVATKALANRAGFDLGTNFSTWVHRIMVNHFISGVRIRRDFVSIEQMPDVSIAPEQPIKLDLDRLNAEIQRLPAGQRELLRQIAIEEYSYEDVSKSSGCAIGTLKSRVHRARSILRARLDGEERLAA
jgi:RNA polymerase sigma-70 factor, ECF subfamily